jgi:hypothetical protein
MPETAYYCFLWREHMLHGEHSSLFTVCLSMVARAHKYSEYPKHPREGPSPFRLPHEWAHVARLPRATRRMAIRCTFPHAYSMPHASCGASSYQQHLSTIAARRAGMRATRRTTLSTSSTTIGYVSDDWY